MCINDSNHYNLKLNTIYKVEDIKNDPVDDKHKYFVIMCKCDYDGTYFRVVADSKRFIKLGELGEITYGEG